MLNIDAPRFYIAAGIAFYVIFIKVAMLCQARHQGWAMKIEDNYYYCILAPQLSPGLLQG
jgi:hypothetical protein